MANCDSNKNINKTFIIEPLELTAGTPTVSACTAVYTSKVLACSGDTFIELYSGVTINGDTLINNSLSANTIDASIILSGGTNILDIVNANDTFVTGGTFNDIGDSLSLLRNDGNGIVITGITDFFTTGATLVNETIVFDRKDALSAYTVDISSVNSGDTFVTGGTLVNKELVLDRNDSLSAVTVDLSGLTTVLENGNGTTASGSSVDLGGVLTKDTFIKGLKNLHLGYYDGTTPYNYPDSLSMLGVTAFGGTATLVPGSSGYFQRKNGAGDNTWYADTTTANMGFNPESNLTNKKHYINQQPSSYTRNIYITNDLAPLNKLKHDFSVANGWIETSLYRDFGSFVVSNKISNNYSGVAINGQGITSAWNLQLGGTNGDTHILTNPTSTLSFGLNEHSFTDLSSSRNGFKLLGFGEANNNDTTSVANYSGLTNTSLIPKRFLIDYVASTSANTFVTGTTFTNNQLNITLNNGTSVETTIDNLSGLTVDGNVLINGDVNIIGSATTINSEQVLIKDNIITLNSNVTGSTTPILNSGFEVLRGSGDTKSILWLENTDLWSVDDDLSVSGYVSGTTYYGDGSNLTGIGDTFVTGGTYSGSTIILNRNDGNSVDVTGITSSSIYTADGTLTGDRILSLSSNDLTFNGTGLFKISNGSKSVYPNWNVHSAFNIDNGNGTVWTLYNANASSTFNANEFGIGVGSSIPFRIFGGDKIALGNVSKGDLDTNYSVNIKDGLFIQDGQFKIETKSNQTITTLNNGYPSFYFDNNTTSYQLGNADSSSGTFDEGDFFIYNSSTVKTNFLITKTGKTIISNGATAVIGTEDISLQGDTLISKKLELSTTDDGFLMPRLTTAQKNAISTPSTDLLIFNTDTDAIERYNGSVWVSANLPKYILKSGGVNKPYSDFKAAFDDSVSGDVIEINVSETVDVGGGVWNWNNSITIQTNGHDTTLSNHSGLQTIGTPDLHFKIIGGGSFGSSSTNFFNIYETTTITSDGATNFFNTATGNSYIFRNLGNASTKTLTVNNVYSKTATYAFISCSNSFPKTILNNCNVDFNNSVTSNSAIFHIRNVEVNGGVFKHNTNVTYPQNTGYTTVADDAFIFNNCTLIGNLGRCMLRLNNCSVITNTTSTSGIYQVTLEANNTSFNHTTTSTNPAAGFAIQSNNELVILKNCNIKSNWSGVQLSTKPSIIDNCVITCGNAWGVYRYNTSGVGFATIKNSTIEVGAYSVIGFNTTNKGKQYDISNTTIITSGATSNCLSLPTGTHARFDNLKLKNLATPANILNRADLLTENPQINTLDNLGNIVLA